MRVVDFSFTRPEWNLAYDELLLNEAETGRGGPTLRFWESPAPFVVMGVAQKLADEVLEEVCLEDQIPIQRRCSAGGCVLQGPGCLNYCLVLDTQAQPELRTIHGSYEYILGRLAESFRNKKIPAEYHGISDLAVENKKISGNAQRRRRRYLLHHGTFLYQADLSLLPKYLKEPVKRPEYRGGRHHLEFVRNIPLGRIQIIDAIREAFAPGEVLEEVSLEEQTDVDRLAREKYALDSWVRRR